jgi:small redox-active disulfide protein 2
MKIEILGTGCPNCKRLAMNVDAAIKELNLRAEIKKVTDIDDISGYSVTALPALVIDGNIVSSGKLLDKNDIKKILVR